MIIDVEASTAVRQAEVTAQRIMIERTADRFGIWPERLAADTGYGSAENLAWLVHERGIEPHVPVFDKSRRSDGTFSRDAFIYDHDRDQFQRAIERPEDSELLLRHEVQDRPPDLLITNYSMLGSDRKIDFGKQKRWFFRDFRVRA